MHGSEDTEVKDNDHGDEEPKEHKEFALREEISLASLVDQLGNVAHRLVHGHAFEAAVDGQPENEPKHAEDDAEEKQLVAIDSEKSYLRKIRHLQASFTAGFLSRSWRCL